MSPTLTRNSFQVILPAIVNATGYWKDYFSDVCFDAISEHEVSIRLHPTHILSHSVLGLNDNEIRYKIDWNRLKLLVDINATV